MKTSESIKEIATALNKAQGEMVGANKNSANPFYKSTYSSLADIMRAISKPFYDNKLCFVQGAEYQEGMIAVVTRIMHESGEWIESTTMLPAVKNDPQAYGSAITYGKRYGLQALSGIPSVDDDGQMASIASQEANQDLIDKAVPELIKLIEAEDPAFTVNWDELNRDEQEICWKALNTKQKKTGRELLDKVRKDNQEHAGELK